MPDYTEKLLQAVDILVKERMNSISFDTTVDAVIVDDSHAADGAYKVSTGSTKFYAYADNKSYKRGEAVMVTIPQGDYNRQKIITGRQTESIENSLDNTLPFDKIIDISGNLINSSEPIEMQTDTSSDESIIVLGNSIYKELQDTDVLIDFSYIGLKAKFAVTKKKNEENENDNEEENADDNEEIVSGDYGLMLELTFFNFYEQEEKKTLIFSNKNFLGNDIYNLDFYNSQQIIFDISAYKDCILKNIKIYPYHYNNFKDKNNMRQARTICIKDFYLCLGKDKKNFTGNLLEITTPSPSFYNLKTRFVQGDKNEKILNFYFIYEHPKNKEIMIFSQGKLPQGYHLCWYKYTSQIIKKKVKVGWTKLNYCTDLLTLAKEQLDNENYESYESNYDTIIRNYCYNNPNSNEPVSELEFYQNINKLNTDQFEIKIDENNPTKNNMFYPNVKNREEQIKAVLFKELEDNPDVLEQVAESNIIKFILEE